MGNLWTVEHSTANLTSSGTALFRGNVTTLGQFLGDGTGLTGVATDAELTTTSGHLQSQIDNLDATYATDANVTSISGHLQGQITSANADVSSLNGLQDAVTLAGSAFINVTTLGQTITVSADALIGADGITVSSGTSSVTLTGFYNEFTTASGHLQTQINNFQSSDGGGNALIGAGSITVTSGVNTTTVSGAEVIDKNFIANTGIGQFDFVHITTSGNRVAPSIASSSDSIEVLGMALSSASAGAAVNVRLHGVVEGANNALGFAVGSPVFLSASTYGDGTVSAPTNQGQFILQLGHALNSADFYVNVNSATAIENTAEITPVLTINSVSGTVTLIGTGATSVTTQGQTITVNTPVDKAIVGDSFVAVVSGANSINLSADAIVGGTGISVSSGTNTVTITNTFGAGSLSAIVGDSFISVTSGTDSIQLSADSILGTDGNTIISGSNSVTVQGFRTEFVNASGSLQSQITTFSDHGNLSGLADDDHLQYFRTSATSETTRIVGGNDLVFQSDGSRGTPGSNTTLTIDGATGNLDTFGTLRVRGLSGSTVFDGNVHIGNLTVTGSQTIFNSVTEVVNNLLVSGSLTVGDPNTPFEDKLNLRGDLDVTLDSSRSADTVVEITHSGAPGSWDIAGTNNLWHVTNEGNGFFQNLTVTGTVTGIDHGQLTGLADDDHTQYILTDGTRAFTGTIQANASGTLDIGTPNTPFDEMFGTPVVREYVAVSGAPRRGMIAIDSNNQFVGYNGSSWIIIG